MKEYPKTITRGDIEATLNTLSDHELLDMFDEDHGLLAKVGQQLLTKAGIEHNGTFASFTDVKFKVDGNIHTIDLDGHGLGDYFDESVKGRGMRETTMQFRRFITVRELKKALKQLKRSGSN